jgi:hypothetical protein
MTRFGASLPQPPPNVHPGRAGEIAEHERAWWRARVRETFRAADGGARFEDFDSFFTALFDHYADARAWRLAPGVHEGLLPRLSLLKGAPS